jgi:hypothetical protein
MKAWTTASGDGQCSHTWGHFWKAGDRIFRVSGATWTKDYCPQCAHHQGAPPDTGEVLELSDTPTYPRPLKALADQVREQFDARMAAAGKDAD